MNSIVISQTIYRFCMSDEDKRDLALLLDSMKDVIRINVKKGDICVASTKSMLTNLGLQYSEVTTPPNENYVCGLIVSKSRARIREFENALRKGDNETLIKLFGYCFKLPMQMPKSGTDDHRAMSAISKLAPALYQGLNKHIVHA